MSKPQYHFLVCNSFRLSGEPQGACNKEGAVDLLQYLEQEIIDRSIDAQISSTGCLKICDRGPVMVVYPAGRWFSEVTEEKIDEVLDALDAGQPLADSLLFS